MTKTSFVIGPCDVVLAILDNSYDNSPDGRFNAVIIDRGSNTLINVGDRCNGFNTSLWTPVTLDLSITKVPTFSEKCEGLPTDDLAEAYNLLYPNTRSYETTV